MLKDRYWAVTNVDYIYNRNAHRIGTMIGVIWSVACIVSLAPTFGWKDSEFTKRIEQDKECLPSQEVSYQIFATCATFYVPLALILILYWKIYQVSRLDSSLFYFVDHFFYFANHFLSFVDHFFYFANHFYLLKSS